ncbi:MAG: hypothetical protein KF832_29480 [Caldilineaceae bacterium]|nr:hypothetical protein [Caldilineaceae bacterium]
MPTKPPPGMGATTQERLSGVSMGLAGSVGALLGGVLYERIGATPMFGWGGVVVLIGLLFFAVAGRQAAELQQTSSSHSSLASTSHPDQ